MSITPLHEPLDLEGVITSFRTVLQLPDPGIVELALATIAANRMTGDPLWLILVGPPSSGKTEVIDSLGDLADTHPVSTFSEAGLLSGSAVSADDREASGGLLIQLGEQGVLLFKDMTTIFSEHKSTRNRIFACLREVYDGHYSKWVGTKGGRMFGWAGKAGLLGAATDAVDTVDLGQLGERFVYYRLPELGDAGSYAASRQAFENIGRQPENRIRLAADVLRFFSGLDLPVEPPALDAQSREWLIALAGFGARCRSSVIRDGHDRSIELVPSPERSPRLLAQLGQLISALLVIGVGRKEARRLVAQVALDGIHKGRKSVLDVLISREGEHALATISGYARLPETTTRRHLEDLTAHGVCDLTGQAPDHWRLSRWSRDQLEAIDLPDLGESAPGGEP